MSENNEKKGTNVSDIVSETFKKTNENNTTPGWKPAVRPVGRPKEKEKKKAKTFYLTELCVECIRIHSFYEKTNYSQKVEEYIMEAMPEHIKQEAMKMLGMDK